MYDHCVGIGGGVMVWVMLTKLHLGSTDANTQWNCVRHFLAAAHIEFYALQAAPPYPRTLSETPLRRRDRRHRHYHPTFPFGHRRRRRHHTPVSPWCRACG